MFKLNLERILDDFVLLTILAGFDFLPPLECFKGTDVLLENLVESYKAVLPSLGGYITQIGRVSGERLQQVISTYHRALTFLLAGSLPLRLCRRRSCPPEAPGS